MFKVFSHCFFFDIQLMELDFLCTRKGPSPLRLKTELVKKQRAQMAHNGALHLCAGGGFWFAWTES